MQPFQYRMIIQELQRCFDRAEAASDPYHQRIAEQTRRRFIDFLDIDHSLPLEDVLYQLENKWRAEGLLDPTDDHR